MKVLMKEEVKKVGKKDKLLKLVMVMELIF